MYIGGRNADRADLLGKEGVRAEVAGDHSTAVRDEVIARVDTIAELCRKMRRCRAKFFKQDDSVNRMRGKGYG